MTYFLYPSNISNFLLALLTVFLQFRTVQNTRSLAVLCQGPCKYLGPDWCFHGYTLILPSAATAGILNIHMLYYRTTKMKNEKVRFIHGLWYLVPIMIIFCFYIRPIDFEFVYEETLSSHPDYDFSPYMKFGGFADSHDVYAVLVNLSLMITATCAPMFGYRWRKPTLNILEKHHNSLSASRISQFRDLIHVGLN
uniref:Serpentine receptor class gamma n=1 Tax=Caenorhabditis tropicalis TaxID=1561998 RepID=A0A1I7T1K8_9PELO